MSDFTAATWNVFHGTKIDVLRPKVARLKRLGVSLIYVQEATRESHEALFAEFGFEVIRGGWECLIAFDPEVWELRRHRTVRLSPTTYFRKTGRAVPYMEAPLVTLRHRATGKRLKALSYHTPSAVQRGGKPNRKVKARLRVTENAMTLFRDLNSRFRASACFAGDDNWDERLGHWRVMGKRFTGLRVVQAPAGTHGKRRIDDFRVRDLTPRSGITLVGGGDHKIHVRSFDF